MYLIDIFILLLVVVISGIGMFHSYFEDTFLQRIGMVLLAIGALSIAHRVWIAEWISHSDSTLIWGIALYSLGTWLKTRRYYCKDHHKHE